MNAAPRVEQKWRPPLSWIVFAVLLAVLALPAAVVIWFRALDATSSRMGPIELTALGVALVLTLLIAVVFSRTITGPINALIARTNEIGRGGRAAIEAPEQHGTRELAVLSQSFLDLAERLVERTEYVNSFAAHVSHELKSPLTSIRGSAELLLDQGMSSEDRQRFISHIISDADRLAALLERLRSLAQAEIPLDAKGVTPGLAAVELSRRFPGLDISVSGPDVQLGLSAEALQIILGHLADNAMQHGATALRLAVSTTTTAAILRVSDNGSGISGGNRVKIFEPFFTTRRDLGGTGMGLGIAQSMLQAHGGHIKLLPSAGGANFEITVPLLDAP